MHRVLVAAQQLCDTVVLARQPGWERVEVRLAPVAGWLVPVQWDVRPRAGGDYPLWLGSDEAVQHRHLAELAAELRGALADDGVPWRGERFARRQRGGPPSPPRGCTASG